MAVRQSLVKGLALTRSGCLELLNSRWYQHVMGRGCSVPFWVWPVGSKALVPLAGHRYRGRMDWWEPASGVSA